MVLAPEAFEESLGVVDGFRGKRDAQETRRLLAKLAAPFAGGNEALVFLSGARRAEEGGELSASGTADFGPSSRCALNTLPQEADRVAS